MVGTNQIKIRQVLISIRVPLETSHTMEKISININNTNNSSNNNNINNISNNNNDSNNNGNKVDNTAQSVKGYQPPPSLPHFKIISNSFPPHFLKSPISPPYRQIGQPKFSRRLFHFQVHSNVHATYNKIHARQCLYITCLYCRVGFLILSNSN